MPWAYVAAAVVSAGAGVYGSSQASKAATKGSDQAVAEQRRQYDTTMSLLEPQRALGYGAMSDLSSLYGYKLPAYPSGPTSGPGSVSVDGQRASGAHSGFINDPTGLVGSSRERRFPGEIDFNAGTVTLPERVKNAAARSDLATRYLRGEDVKLGKKFKRIRNAIDEAKYNGYVYSPADPNAVPYSPVTSQPQTGGTSADGTAGNMSRFFASPDYKFRMGEGVKALDQSAASRGGLFSGNAGRAITEYGSNIASGEYGNYVNRLMAIAGLGQTATGAAVNAGTNTANNISGSYQDAANTRASGIIGATNTITGGINAGMNNWLMYRNRVGG